MIEFEIFHHENYFIKKNVNMQFCFQAFCYGPANFFFFYLQWGHYLWGQLQQKPNIWSWASRYCANYIAFNWIWFFSFWSSGCLKHRRVYKLKNFIIETIKSKLIFDDSWCELLRWQIFIITEIEITISRVTTSGFS